MRFMLNASAAVRIVTLQLMIPTLPANLNVNGRKDDSGLTVTFTIRRTIFFSPFFFWSVLTYCAEKGELIAREQLIIGLLRRE